MRVKNLWGKLPSGDELKAPVTILREQAAMLGELTEGLLEGHVRVGAERETFHAYLSIVARVLNNFSYGVVHLIYGVTLYPLELEDTTVDDENKVECADREALETCLGEILSSDRVKQVVAGLLAQSKAEM